MNTLTNSLPWKFWFFLGCFGILVLLKYAIWPRKNTPPIPFVWNILWLVCLFISFLVIARSFIDGTGLYSEYLPFIGKATVPAILLLFLTLFVGGYQIMIRPNFDPRKRRIVFIQMFICIGCIISLAWLLGPFIWDRYYK